MEVTGVSSINILWLRGRHSRQLHVFHQAVHSADTDVNAITHVAIRKQSYRRQVFCCSQRKCAIYRTRWPDFPYYEGQGWKRSAYSRYFCLPVGHDTRSWCCVAVWVCKQQLIFLRVWREDGNRFFRMTFSSSRALRFCRTLICLAVRISPHLPFLR